LEGVQKADQRVEGLRQSFQNSIERSNNSALSIGDRKAIISELCGRFHRSSDPIKRLITSEWLAAGGVNWPKDTQKESRELMMEIYGDRGTPPEVKETIWDHIWGQTESHLNHSGAVSEKPPIDFLSLIELHRNASGPEEKRKLETMMLRIVNETHLTQENRAEVRDSLQLRMVGSNDPDERSEILKQSLLLNMEQFKDPSIPVKDRKEGLEGLRNKFSGFPAGTKAMIASEWLAAGGLNLPEDTRKESWELMMAIFNDRETPPEVKAAISSYYQALPSHPKEGKVPGTSQDNKKIDKEV
jgi:hypothetical protein